MIMKTFALLTSALLFVPMALGADSPKTKLDKACKTAADAKKDVLLVFSGSKWNQASKDLEAQVLGSPEFPKTAAKNFVQALIEIPATREEAHEELLQFEQDYKFRIIPTVILADSKGRPYATMSEVKTKPEEFFAELTKLAKIRTERDQQFEMAQKAEGKKKAEFIVKGLKMVPEDSLIVFYEPELAMIEKADPKDETKFAGKIRKDEAIRKERLRYSALLNEKKYEEVIKQSRAEGAKLKGADAQRLRLYEVQALFRQRKYEEALKLIEPLKKMAPNSDLGKQCDQYAKQIEARIKAAERMKKAAEERSKPVVSKPVAIVTDINQLRKDAKKAEEDFAQAQEKEKGLVRSNQELAKKITAAEAELAKLRKEEKAAADALEKAAAEREKLGRKSKAMKEVVENHEAMEKRKREISELEKRAAELQKQAEELREKASEIRKGK